MRFIHQRCLVVADGFYEWLNQDKEKIPYYTRLKSKEIPCLMKKNGLKTR